MAHHVRDLLEKLDRKAALVLNGFDEPDDRWCDLDDLVKEDTVNVVPVHDK